MLIVDAEQEALAVIFVPRQDFSGLLPTDREISSANFSRLGFVKGYGGTLVVTFFVESDTAETVPGASVKEGEVLPFNKGVHEGYVGRGR